MSHSIILISGKQGSGKSTLAAALYKKLRLDVKYYPQEFYFAQPLYQMHDFCRNILKENGVIPPHAVKDGNLLQLLGTEWGRKCVDEDIWVKLMKGKIHRWLQTTHLDRDYQPIFIVSDCRFMNEFEGFPEALRIRLSCGKAVRKARCSMWRENDTHPSEIDLDEYANEDRFDFHFDSGITTPEYMADLIYLQIVKNDWVTKRKLTSASSKTKEKNI